MINEINNFTLKELLGVKFYDEPQHKALLVKDDKVIHAAHLESWKQDALVEEDKTDEEMAKADEVIYSLRKYWEI